jgi:hypothetical protein
MATKHRRGWRALTSWPNVAATIVAACAVAAPAPGGAQTASAPYPPSTVITGISFDWSSYDRQAPGSDNWAITWSGDDHQYAPFGDGGGFNGNEVRGRVSLGVARIEGSAARHRGRNVWGGVNAATSAKFTGKSKGMLAVGTELYMWRCGAGSMASNFDFQQLFHSTNGGVTWRAANWMFPRSLTFYCPNFLQAGKGYADAPDGFVYMYAAERNSETWGVHQPGAIRLMRAPAARLMDRAAYQFFTGTNDAGEPGWSADPADRAPVFKDPNGVHLVAVTRVPELGRYLLSTVHDVKNDGDIGIFDGPSPWGPWTTVLYEEDWGKGHLKTTTTFFLNFASKWWSNEGRDFVLVFTGTEALDAWNTVKGSLRFDGRGRDGRGGRDARDGRTGVGTPPAAFAEPPAEAPVPDEVVDLDELQTDRPAPRPRDEKNEGPLPRIGAGLPTAFSVGLAGPSAAPTPLTTSMTGVRVAP